MLFHQYSYFCPCSRRATPLHITFHSEEYRRCQRVKVHLVRLHRAEIACRTCNKFSITGINGLIQLIGLDESMGGTNHRLKKGINNNVIYSIVNAGQQVVRLY